MSKTFTIKTITVLWFGIMIFGFVMCKSLQTPTDKTTADDDFNIIAPSSKSAPVFPLKKEDSKDTTKNK